MQTETPPTYRRQSEVAQQTSLSRVTLWRMALRGDFPTPVRLSPGRVGYLASDVDAWIAARKPSGDAA